VFAAKDKRPFVWQINVTYDAPQRLGSHKIENLVIAGAMNNVSAKTSRRPAIYTDTSSEYSHG
jgi:hypothetical protein